MDDVVAPAQAPADESPTDESPTEVMSAPDVQLDQVPEPPETGDQAVDDAVLRLAAAASEPLENQVAAFDAAHRALQDRLADVES